MGLYSFRDLYKDAWDMKFLIKTKQNPQGVFKIEKEGIYVLILQIFKFLQFPDTWGSEITNDNIYIFLIFMNYCVTQ